MATTVAPLTTTVMTSFGEEKHAGAASGINNTVARAAGLLSIALFGALSIMIFARALDARLASNGASPALRQTMAAQRLRLAEAKPPATLNPTEKAPHHRRHRRRLHPRLPHQHAGRRRAGRSKRRRRAGNWGDDEITWPRCCVIVQSASICVICGWSFPWPSLDLPYRELSLMDRWWRLLTKRVGLVSRLLRALCISADKSRSR
jgi:hypothetical protein